MKKEELELLNKLSSGKVLVLVCCFGESTRTEPFVTLYSFV